MKKILIMLILCTACNEEYNLKFKDSVESISHPECTQEQIDSGAIECTDNEIVFNPSGGCGIYTNSSTAQLNLGAYVDPEDCNLSFDFKSEAHVGVVPTENVSFKDQCTLTGNKYSCDLGLIIDVEDLTDMKGTMQVSCKNRSPSKFNISGSNSTAVWHQDPPCAPPGGGGGGGELL